MRKFIKRKFKKSFKKGKGKRITKYRMSRGGIRL